MPAMILFLLAAAPTYLQLHSDAAQASSFLRSSWNRFEENYHPNYVLDNNPATAWVEGVDGNGEGQRLTLPLSHVSGATALQLRIANGYQKSEALLAANAAPARVRIEVSGESGSASLEATLERKMGWQVVDVPLPAGIRFSSVSLTVLSVTPGKSYKDTCISDVQVWVAGNMPYNAVAEAAKHQQALAWIADRVAAANYFAQLPQVYPYQSTHWHQTEGAAKAADFEGLPAYAELKLSPPSNRYKPAFVQDFRSPESEGEWLPELEDWLNATNVSLFETDQTIARSFKLEESWETEHWQSSASVEWADVEKRLPKRIWFTERLVVEERGTYIQESHYLLSYDASGRLDHFWLSKVSSDECGKRPEDRYYGLSYDTAGKVSKIHSVWRMDERNYCDSEAGIHYSQMDWLPG